MAKFGPKIRYKPGNNVPDDATKDTVSPPDKEAVSTEKVGAADSTTTQNATKETEGDTEDTTDITTESHDSSTSQLPPQQGYLYLDDDLLERIVSNPGGGGGKVTLASLMAGMAGKAQSKWRMRRLQDTLVDLDQQMSRYAEKVDSILKAREDDVERTINQGDYNLLADREKEIQRAARAVGAAAQAVNGDAAPITENLDRFFSARHRQFEELESKNEQEDKALDKLQKHIKEQADKILKVIAELFKGQSQGGRKRVAPG